MRNKLTKIINLWHFIIYLTSKHKQMSVFKGLNFYNYTTYSIARAKAILARYLLKTWSQHLATPNFASFRSISITRLACLKVQKKYPIKMSIYNQIQKLWVTRVWFYINNINARNISSIHTQHFHFLMLKPSTSFKHHSSYLFSWFVPNEEHSSDTQHRRVGLCHLPPPACPIHPSLGLEKITHLANTMDY